MKRRTSIAVLSRARQSIATRCLRYAARDDLLRRKREASITTRCLCAALALALAAVWWWPWYWGAYPVGRTKEVAAAANG